MSGHRSRRSAPPGPLSRRKLGTAWGTGDITAARSKGANSVPGWTGSGDRGRSRTSYDIFLQDAPAGVDIDLPQRPGPGVDELVGHARGRHHDLPGAHLDGRVADGEGGLALQRQEDLFV